MKRLVSWNVNGLRAAVQKDFDAHIADLAPDVLCLQETKAQDDQVAEAIREVASLNGYHLVSSSAEKKGYSGTALLSKELPNRVIRGIGGGSVGQRRTRRLCRIRRCLHRNRLHPPTVPAA